MLGLGFFEMIILLAIGFFVIVVPLVVIGIVLVLNGNKPKQQ